MNDKTPESAEQKPFNKFNRELLVMASQSIHRTTKMTAGMHGTTGQLYEQLVGALTDSHGQRAALRRALVTLMHRCENLNGMSPEEAVENLDRQIRLTTDKIATDVVKSVLTPAGKDDGGTMQ